MNRKDVSKVWLTDTGISLRLKDGRCAEEPFAKYGRLANADASQRENFILSHFGIHWPEIDEDLSYEGFFK